MITRVYLLEGETLGFGDKKCCKNTEHHKNCEDLHNMVKPVVCSALVSEWRQESLGENSTSLASGGRDPVRSGTITSRERFAGN